MKDAVDKALQDLAEFAGWSSSNLDIVAGIQAVRALRTTEIAKAEAEAAHVLAMRKEVCASLNITPGALVALQVDAP